jgi:1,4-dihydroxy-2-naphthoyl-CoA hydrolase
MESPIWFKKDLKVSDIQSFGDNNLGAHLGMKFADLGPDFLKGTMPVDHRTRQPYGLLHGGASVALAETLGSVASALVVDHEKYMCVGLEINANHVRSAREGLVTGTCSPIHLGKTTHVWDIRIHDDKGKLVCVSRLTVAVIKR